MYLFKVRLSLEKQLLALCNFLNMIIAEVRR